MLECASSTGQEYVGTRISAGPLSATARPRSFHSAYCSEATVNRSLFVRYQGVQLEVVLERLGLVESRYRRCLSGDSSLTIWM